MGLNSIPHCTPNAQRSPRPMQVVGSAHTFSQQSEGWNSLLPHAFMHSCIHSFSRSCVHSFDRLSACSLNGSACVPAYVRAARMKSMYCSCARDTRRHRNDMLDEACGPCVRPTRVNTLRCTTRRTPDAFQKHHVPKAPTRSKSTCTTCIFAQTQVSHTLYIVEQITSHAP